MSSEYNKRVWLVRSELHREAVATQSFVSCLNCSNWNVEHQGCELYKKTPPPQIIVYGCEEHQFDIPF